jgi:hypothetical protein
VIKKSESRPKFTIRELLSMAKNYGVQIPNTPEGLNKFLLFGAALWVRGTVEGYQNAMDIWERLKKKNKRGEAR